jgi:hypothetical protein
LRPQCATKSISPGGPFDAKESLELPSQDRDVLAELFGEPLQLLCVSGDGEPGESGEAIALFLELLLGCLLDLDPVLRCLLLSLLLALFLLLLLLALVVDALQLFLALALFFLQLRFLCGLALLEDHSQHGFDRLHRCYRPHAQRLGHRLEALRLRELERTIQYGQIGEALSFVPDATLPFVLRSRKLDNVVLAHFVVLIVLCSGVRMVRSVFIFRSSGASAGSGRGVAHRALRRACGQSAP